MQTITRISIHLDGENPVFGEGVIRVSLDDEAEGPHIVLDTPDASSLLRMSYIQMKEVMAAAAQLMSQDAIFLKD